MKKILNEYKKLKISRNKLEQELGNLFSVEIEKPVIITNKDVINALTMLKNKKITVAELVDWVNVMWFTDLYDYSDKYSDSIASVMNILEELDEDKSIITNEDIDIYIDALRKNEEIL